MTAYSHAVDVGLCENCCHCRTVRTDRSTFHLCERGLVDPGYQKYPILPVRTCRGYEPADADTPKATEPNG